MDLDDSNQSGSLSNGSSGTGKQVGERNLATRRHTVGPSETAHDHVGKHLKMAHSGTKGAPHFYPATEFVGLGYSPWNVPSNVAYNPLAGFNQMERERLGLSPNLDLSSRPPNFAHSAFNAQLPPTPGFQPHGAMSYGKGS